MTKIFNNTDKKAFPSENNPSVKGWTKVNPYNDKRIANISDTVGAGIALAKMGTSIPTPMARIFMFNTAFGQTNALGHDNQTVYGKLVSECLDFLEFIYNYGTDIEVKSWNVAANIASLQNSNHQGHKKLGKCLDKFARDLGMKDIYLFYYHGVLIGGSSPYTLVYTSPNWQRVKPITDAKGMAGNELFANYSDAHTNAVPLNARHHEFREYLTKVIAAFNGVGAFARTPFWNYVYQSEQTTYDTLMGANPYTVASFLGEYDTLKDGTDIDLLGLGGAQALFLGYRKAAIPAVTPGGVVDPNACPAPDYQLVSTKQPGGPQPLIISDNGVTGAVYVGGLPWQPGTQVTRNPAEPLNSRVLPGPGHLTYPYLTDADFLEDRLLKVSYTVNHAAFHTFGMPEHYLLPLKPRFFEYFNIKDMGEPTVQHLNFAAVETADDGVDVTLTLPIKCKARPFIELKKHYTADEIEVVNPQFSLGVFPSYKILGGAVPNQYAVLFNGLAISTKLKAQFLTIDGATVNDQVPTVPAVNREQDSRFVAVKGAFDLIQLDWDGVKALAIPAFKEVTPKAGNVVVGIDFGTTNSYVSLSFDGGAAPQTLDITKDDQQLLTLNKIDLSHGNFGNDYKDSMSSLPTMARAIDREFVPLLLGQDSDVAFPYRTVVCETDAFAGKGADAYSLFGDINVGFNFMKEEFDLAGTKYSTNIKWDLQTVDDLTAKQNRVKAYCRQIAWMVKNKVMLSGIPASKVKVFLTFPYTMGAAADDIRTYWGNAFNELMGPDNTTIEDTTESIAPFFYLVGIDKVKFSKNALNVDIGGGTTDMLFADVENQRFYYNSSLYAGNDLWGDGLQLVNNHQMDNGFVAYFEELLNAGHLSVSDSRKDSYERYKKIVDNSADLMSYIFRYDNEFNFISYIKSSKDKLMPVLFVHLAAEVYHIAQVLKEKNITVPTTISFSGMGAQYIKMISNDDKTITALVGGLLAAFMGYGFDDEDDQMPKGFKVQFQKSPKIVTAQGAMLTGHPNLSDFKDYKEKETYVYGVEVEPDKKGKKKIKYGDAPKYQEQALQVFEQFLDDFLGDEDITNFIQKKFSVKFSDEILNTLKEAAEGAYNLMAKSKDGNETIEETLFFWPLKNGLYEASKL